MCDELIEEYRRTHYRVFDPEGEFALIVDQPAPELERCHARHGVGSSAFITAWNPGSRPREAALNKAAQGKLLAEIRRRGWSVIDASGEGPDGRWPPEPSVLVLGIPESDARQLGRDHGQKAVVFAGPDAIPRLLILY
jgi:hypothetical protein